MLYLIQYTAYSALLYIVYTILLRNRVVHAWNRFYLVACATIPLALPLVKLQSLAASLPALPYSLPEVIIPSSAAATSGGLVSFNLVAPAYLTIAAFLLAYTAVRYAAASRNIGRHSYNMHNGARIYTHTGMGPGSLGRSIFFPGGDINPTILNHELAHVHLRHTADLLLMRLLQCLFWPNVFLHLIARELRMVHEFQADELSAGDTTSFSNLLLAQSFNVRPGILEHTFFHHPIKRRIIMLQKKSDRRRPLIPAALRSGFAALLVTTGIIYLQSCSRKATPEPTVYSNADKMARADYDLATYIGNNVKYPEDAKNRKVEGRVIVKFVVDKNGEITKPEVVRSPDQTLSDEAIRVVSAMPKWEPAMKGNEPVPVYFHLPITFALDNKPPAGTKQP